MGQILHGSATSVTDTVSQTPASLQRRNRRQIVSSCHSWVQHRAMADRSKTARTCR